MDYYSIKDVQLYPPGLGDFFHQLGVSQLGGHSAVTDILWLVFAIFLVIYTIVSIALFYHWITYGMRNKYIIFAELSFSIVSIFLFWTAAIIITTL